MADVGLADPYHKPDLALNEVPQMLGGTKPEARGKGPVRGARSEGDAPMPSDETDGLTRDEIQRIVQNELDDAATFIDGEIAPDRVALSQYYHGIMEDVPEEDGRSRAVHRVVHDTILQILPSLIRVFTSAERVVRFAPNKPGQEEGAKQRTEYINHLFFQKNKGFMVLHSLFKDALIRRMGIVKWGLDTRRTITREKYTGLTRVQLDQLLSDEDITDAAVHQSGTVDIPIDADSDDAIGLTDGLEEAQPAAAQGAPATGTAMVPAQQPQQSIVVPLFDVTIRRECTKSEPIVYAIPGEEFLYSRGATSIEDATIVAHRSLKTRTDLIAMGVPADWLDERIGGDNSVGFLLNPELTDRRPDVSLFVDPFNESLARTLYTESYIRVDTDGDGIAELKKACTVGWQHEMYDDPEDVTEIPFAMLCPDPEPHQFQGNSVADDVKDIQRIDSLILRSTLDSLAQSVVPRTVVNPNKVNVKDVLNTEVGGIIRADDPTQVVVHATPFVGRDGLTLLDYFDGIVQQRTGVLAPPDAEDLQSTTRKAVDLTERQATQRIELIARILAEMGLKPLFLGLQRLVMRTQDVAEQVRLRGEWVNIDPSTWDAEMDVVITVGLGQGTNDERIGILKEHAAEMKDILMQAGPDNPMVGWAEFRHVHALITELSGYPDTQEFWKPIPANYVPPMPPQPPSPQELLAQTTREETAMKERVESRKLIAQHVQQQREAELEKFRIEMDFRKAVAVAQISATKDAEAANIDAMLRLIETDAENAIRAHEARLDAMARHHEAETSANAQVATAALSAAGNDMGESSDSAAGDV